MTYNSLRPTKKNVLLIVIILLIALAVINLKEIKRGFIEGYNNAPDVHKKH